MAREGKLVLSMKSTSCLRIEHHNQLLLLTGLLVFIYGNGYSRLWEDFRYVKPKAGWA